MSSPIVVTFQPSNAVRRNQHREVRLAARAGERGRDVGLLALRRGARRGSACARRASPGRAPSPRRCAARSTSCRAAHCRRSRSRTTRSRASPGSARCTWSARCTATATSRCAGRERRADRMHAGHEVAVAAEHVVHRAAHARHDAHADHDVGAVGDLDADVRDRAADRPHRERHDVHRAAAHAAVEQVAQRRAHLAPARASCWSGRRPSVRSLQMNVRSSTRATSDGSESAR